MPNGRRAACGATISGRVCLRSVHLTVSIAFGGTAVKNSLEGTRVNAMSEDYEPKRSVDALDRLTAAFFGVPKHEIPRLQAQDWVAHRAVITFLLVVVIPLSAVSFGHLSTLILASGGETALLSADQVYWASAIGGGLFGVLLTWLNDSGMTIMLRRPGQSWQKAVGLLSRGAFILLNVVLFTAAITAFSLRDRIELKRSDGRSSDIASRMEVSDNKVAALSANIRQGTATITEMTKKLSLPSPIVVSLKQDTRECRHASTAIAEQLQKLKSELASLNNQLKRARVQQSVKSAGELRRRSVLKQTEVSRSNEELSQKQGECDALAEQAKKAESDYLSDVRGSISAAKSQVASDSSELQTSTVLANEARGEADRLAKLGFGTNLSAEYAALVSLLMDPAEASARLIAIVVALFFGLIDLTPVIWGWSLRGGSVDIFLTQRADTYLRSITLAQESIIRHIEAEEAADAAYSAVRSAEEKAHRQRRARFEARLAAARQYADAVAALEKMLASEHQFGTSPEIIDRVRQESVDALSTTFRATSTPETA